MTTEKNNIHIWQKIAVIAAVFAVIVPIWIFQQERNKNECDDKLIKITEADVWNVTWDTSARTHDGKTNSGLTKSGRLSILCEDGRIAASIIGTDNDCAYFGTIENGEIGGNYYCSNVSGKHEFSGHIVQ